MAGSAFTDKLYRAMKDGKDLEVQALIETNRVALREGGKGPDTCVASPLISAVFSERADYLQALLDAGADPDTRDLSRKGSSYNMRALEAALWFRRRDMERILLDAGANEDFGTYLFRRNSKLVRAALKEAPALLESNYIRHDYTLLHVAATLASAPLTKLFVKAGLDPNATDGDGHAPLRYAARNEPCLDVMEALVDAGADVNHASRTGITALTAACRHDDSLPSVHWLLEQGADPNLVPKNGVSALMKAAGNRVTEMARLLLEHGADPEFVGKKGESALDVARRRKATEIVALLE